MKTINFGVDVTALNNRLQMTFDYYKRRTDGMLADGIEIPGVVGTSAPLQNIADLSSDGWELNLTWRDRIGDFAYNIGFNIYDNQAKIKKFKQRERNY